jgi:hypothetical protein
MKKWMLAVLLVLFLQQCHVVEALQMGKLFGRFQPNKVGLPNVLDGVLGPSPTTMIVQTKEELLTVISNTGNGKDASLETQKNALKLVRYLETNAPVPKNLLEDPEASKELDGVWYLQYTAPSTIDTDDAVCTCCCCARVSTTSMLVSQKMLLNTQQILSLFRFYRRIGIPRIAAKGNPESILER